MNLRLLVFCLCVIGVFQNENSLYAQCPDGADLTTNGHCFKAIWEVPPVPIPTSIEFNNQLFNYTGGAGTAASPANYTNSGGGTCNQTGVPFSGTIEVDGEVCMYDNGMLVTPVPVELVDFTAIVRQHQVLLNWTTASELNSKGFGVERSEPSNDWIQIGWVNGAGSSTELISYQYLDRNPSPGISFYRLVQYDADGRKDFSPVQSVDFITIDIDAKVYPVPANSTLFLAGFGSQLNILDMKGALIASHSVNDGSIDISQLEPGMYVLRDIRSGNTVRFVKN